MTTTAVVNASAVLNDGTRDVERFDIYGSVSDVLGENGQRQTISLSSGFTALTVPTGAAAVVIKVTSGAVTITLKGITGDTGIVLQSGTLSTIPIVLPLGTTPSLGLTTNGSATIDVLFL